MTPIGGDGDDSLVGNLGRNLLIGGLGADSLDGAEGGDLFITGALDFDGDEQAAVVALYAEVKGPGTNPTKVLRFTGTPGGLNAPYFLTSSTVVDDDAVDEVLGQGGEDLFFVHALDSPPDYSPTINEILVRPFESTMEVKTPIDAGLQGASEISPAERVLSDCSTAWSV